MRLFELESRKVLKIKNKTEIKYTVTDRKNEKYIKDNEKLR